MPFMDLGNLLPGINAPAIPYGLASSYAGARFSVLAIGVDIPASTGVVDVVVGGNGVHANQINALAFDIQDLDSATLQILNDATITANTGTAMKVLPASRYHTITPPTVAIGATVTDDGDKTDKIVLVPQEPTTGKKQALLQWREAEVIKRHDKATVWRIANTTAQAGKLQVLIDLTYIRPPVV